MYYWPYFQYDASGPLVSMGEWSLESSAWRFGSDSKLKNFGSNSELEDVGSNSKLENVPKDSEPSGVYYLHTR